MLALPSWAIKSIDNMLVSIREVLQNTNKIWPKNESVFYLFWIKKKTNTAWSSLPKWFCWRYHNIIAACRVLTTLIGAFCFAEAQYEYRNLKFLLELHQLQHSAVVSWSNSYPFLLTKKKSCEPVCLETTIEYDL